MWRDDTFSQRNKATNRAGKRGWAKFEKKRGERVSNIEGIHKIGGLETLCQLRLKNGQTYFKNLGVFHTASFLDYVWPFFQDYD